MSFYLIVFQGDNAISSAALGIMAQHAGLTPALLTVAIALGIGRSPPRARPTTGPPRRSPPPQAPNPQEQPCSPSSTGTGQGAHDELLAALRDARFSRRRTGATSWRVWQDATDPDRIVEQFIVASWDDHLRQHERVTRRDAGRLSEIRKMTTPASQPSSPTG